MMIYLFLVNRDCDLHDEVQRKKKKSGKKKKNGIKNLKKREQGQMLITANS